MSRRPAALALAACACAVVAALSPASLAPAARAQQQPTSISLVAQSTWVAPNGSFAAQLALAGAPADGSIQLLLHNRARSRGELRASFEGEGLRSTIYSLVFPLSTLPPDPLTGAYGVALPIRTTDAGDPSRVRLSVPGTYPVEIQVLDAQGTELAHLITYLILLPVGMDGTPPLAVATVLDVGAPPALQPDGTTAPVVIPGLADDLAAMATRAGVPMTVAAVPETLDALVASPDPATADLVDQLRTTLDGRQVAAAPYVAVEPEAMVDAALDEELRAQVDRGRAMLQDQLQTSITSRVWLADPSLGLDGLDALVSMGVTHLVLPPGAATRATTSSARLTEAQPFAIDQAPTTVDGVEVDEALSELLGEPADDPVLQSQQVLADMAVTWSEAPATSRGVVIRPGDMPDGIAFERVLAALGEGGIVRPVTLDQLFAETTPLADRTGRPVERKLEPESPSSLRSIAPSVRDARAQVDSYRTLVGPLSARADPLENMLLLATAAQLDGDQRAAYVDSVVATVRETAAAVEAPGRQTITLTARDGTIPLTLRNTAGFPLHVVVTLASTKLDFPDGNRLVLTLDEETTRIDLRVQARASGAFPLRIDVRSPDGALELASVRYTVRSTAVSGVGLILSIGAGLFLAAWWASHWRRTRRSRRLVDPSDEPEGAPGAA